MVRPWGEVLVAGPLRGIGMESRRGSVFPVSREGIRAAPAAWLSRRNRFQEGSSYPECNLPLGRFCLARNGTGRHSPGAVLAWMRSSRLNGIKNRA